MRVRRRRNITIGILCCMLVFMGIGYAALQQVLTISGTGNITGAWKIEITSITPEEINEGVSVSTNIEDSKTEGSFIANLKKPTDAVVYTVTVENKGTIDAVLESITPEDYAQGDIKYTTTGKDECKNLDSGATCDFTIKVEYLDTGLGQQPTPNGTKVEQQFEIKYVQEGANVNTPGEGNTGGEVDNSPAITVDSTGLLIGYNKEKLTNDEGYVVVPATTESGEKIVSIDKGSFAEYNLKQAYIYNETTGEEIEAYVIYDEENYDEIKSIVMADMEGSGSGSGSYSSNSYVLDKDISPTNLTANYNKSLTLEKLSGSGSGSSEPPKIYSKIDFEELLKQMSSTGKVITEYEYGYANLETGEIEEVVSKVEKLDLTQAINLKTIVANTFAYSELQEIKLPEGIEEIGYSAFERSNLKSINLPSSLKSIGSGIFEGIKDFTFLEINIKNVPSSFIVAHTYDGPIIIENLVIGSNVESVDRNAFSKKINSNNYDNYETVMIKNLSIDMQTIPADVFGERSIEKLTLGPNVESIKAYVTYRDSYYAFSGNKINKLIIPAGVANIDNGTFSGNEFVNSSDITVEYNEENPITRFSSSWNNIGFPGVGPENPKIGCFTTNGGGTILDYSVGETCSTDVVIPNNLGGATIKVIEKNVFKDKEITSLTLPDTITTIKESAFENNSISELIIPNSVTSIEDNAFKNNLITNLVFENTEEKPSGLTTIGSYTFEGNQIGGKVIIPASVSNIGSNAFHSNQISSLIFEDTPSKPSAITSLEYYAFASNQISELTIPSSVRSIGMDAFSYNQISESTIMFVDTEEKPSQLTELSGFAYNKFTKLPKFPSSVTLIGNSAFRGNQLVDAIIIPESIEMIERYAFSENSNLSKIIIKRADSTGMILEDDWNYKGYYNGSYIYYEVEYDPNYEG